MAAQRKPKKKKLLRPGVALELWKINKAFNPSFKLDLEEEDIGTIYVKGDGDITVEFTHGKKVSLKKDVNGKTLVGTIFAEAAKSLLSREK